MGCSAQSTCTSSTGLSLQAHPAPWLYSVNRSGESCSICCAKYRVCLIHAPTRRLSPPTSPARRGGGVVALGFAALAPPGGIAVAGGCAPHERGGAAVPRAGGGGLGRPLAAARPAGAAIAAAASASPRRVAFIASADHGHAHLESGPYGYHPSAARYDALICDLVQTNQLGGLVEIGRDLVEDAKADSWWQMLMLHGATPGWLGTLVSYEAPTYFGMLTAAFLPN